MRTDINAIEEWRKRLYKSDADNVYAEDYLADTEFLLNRINDLTTQLAESKADYEAAVEDMFIAANGDTYSCGVCKHHYHPDRCHTNADGTCTFEYRGRKGK